MKRSRGRAPGKRKEHNWIVEEVDGGHVGVGLFWKCKRCGCAGGPADLGGTPPMFSPFIAGTGVKVGDDCDRAMAIIANYPTYREERK